jgi:2-oxoglutarate ferredoxin oxidoreductase subunit alpha
MEKNNQRMQKKYREIEKTEQRFEAVHCDDADYVFVAFGTSSRICEKAVELARNEGIKAGLLRPVTLYPFPQEAIASMVNRVRGFLSVEMSAGQMIEDIKLAVYEAKSHIPVKYFGRTGGILPTPGEVVNALKSVYL